MAIGFNIQFRIDEKLSSRVIRLTDTSTGFTLAKGNFSIVFPDGTSIDHTDFLSPDINTPGGIYNFQAPTDIYNNVLTGTYRVTFVALDSGNNTYTDSKEFDFNWIKPAFSTINKSDVFIPEVKFQDATSYSPIGSFTITGSLARTFSVQIPSNSEVAPQLKSTSAADLNTIHSGKYYEGLFNVNTDIIVNYTNSSYAYLTLYYTALNVKTFDIRQAPTQLQIVNKMNAFRADIDAYKEKNDTQFEILSEEYDIAVALYSHLMARYQTGTLDGSQPLVEELLSILEPYGGTYSYKATQLTPFSLDAVGSSTFIISDGTTTDTFAMGDTMLFTSNSSALLASVSNNTISYNPVFGTSANTFVQGNDSRMHNPVTIGTANGLSLASQALSLASATTSTPGAMSAADKLKLDGIATGANTGTVTSITVTAPSAFTVSGGTITTSGTIAITGAGTASDYIKGDGSLGVFNTAARGAISLTTTGTSGAATYSSTTGILNIPQYQGGVTSFNTRTGAVVLSSSDVTTALTFTPENAGNKGIAGGYASLDGSGLVPSTQLPSYVDDVLEYADLASLPVTGTTGKIYVTLDTNKIYRWSGSAYIEVSSGGSSVWGAITGTLSNQTDLNSALSGKQATITLTTTGTSGAATLVGATLNIPQYQGGVTSFNTRSGAITLTSGDVTTALTYTPQQPITLTTTGTSGAATFVGNTLNIPQYGGGGGSGSLRGLQNYTATAGQTTFTVTAGYVVGQIDVFLNGVRLTASDYTASDGSTVILGAGALVNDIVDILYYSSLTGYVTAASKQDALSGTGFVKISGTTISYDNSTYLTSYTETDPIFIASAAYGITGTNITNWNSAYGWGNHASAGYLTSYTETDPIFIASAAHGITSTNITNWNTAYGWGNHASAGYLTSYTETDPVFVASPAYGITGTNITNWGSAYSWGNHALAGYLTSYTETDPVFVASSAYGITSTNITNWNTAYGWGNHASAGYLTSFTETDPVFVASPAYGITGTNITNWNTAYGWGNHASAGYLTSFTETDPVFVASASYGITATNITNWNTAYTNRITSLTTTGSSGSATLTSNTLNIPTYTLSGLGGQASSTNLTSLSGLTYASASFVKMTAAGTFALDTNTYYLSSNPSGYTNNAGTVTSVGGTGTAFGLTLTGTVTTSGSLTLGGTLAVPIANITATGTPSSTTYLRGDGTWSTVSSTGGGGYTTTSQTSNYSETATTGTKIILGDTTGGTFTITLPTAVGNASTIIIKKTAGTAALVVDGASSETIDGGLTATINKVYESITLISDNTNWQIV